MMTGRESQRLWTAKFVLAIASNFFIMMVFYMLMTSLALYSVERFGAGESVAGLTSSIYVIGAVVARMFAGKYLDLIGRRRLLLLSLLVFSVAGALYAPTDALWLLLVIRFVHGAAFGAASTTITAAVQSVIPTRRRGEGNGYFGASATAAAAVGPATALLVIDGVGYELLFAFSVACAIAALLIALFLRLPEREATADELARKWRIRITDVFDPAALPITIVAFFVSVLYSSILTFLYTFGKDSGFVEGTALFFIVYAGAMLATRFLVGRIQDRFGDNSVMYPALVSLGIGLLGLGLAQADAVIVLAAVVFGFGHGTVMSSGPAIAVTMAPPHRVGIAVSTFYLGVDGGLGVGPILLGVVATALGFQGMYLVLAAAAIAIVVLYALLHGRKRVRHAEFVR